MKKLDCRILGMVAVAVVFMGASSCKGNGCEGGLISVNYKQIPQGEDVLLSEWVHEPEFIALQSDRAEALVEINSIRVSENYIAVIPLRAVSKMFDRATGEYLYDIGAVGRGPGEYIGIDEMIIDEAHGRILLSNSPQGQLLAYSLKDGAFIGEIPMAYGWKTGYNPEYVFALENGTDGIMVATVSFDDGCPLAAWCQDDEGNILWEIPKNYTLADNSSLSVTAGHNIDGALDMSYRSFNTVRDTLFILKDREIHPLLTIATGTPTGPGFPELSKEGNIFQFSTILTAHIVTQIMIMRGLGPDGGADTKYIVTDRLTGEVAFRKFRNDYLAQDDVSVAFRDGYLFDYFDPVDFQEIARNALQHGRLNEASVHSLSTILGNIKDNDNYIIMLSRLK